MTLGNELFALAVEWLYDHNKVADQKELDRATEFSGALFSTSGTFTITLNDEWAEPWMGTW